MEMKPYFWMIDYTPQKEWIDGRGLWLWLAFFFSEIGAGLFIVSLFLGFWLGGVIGWISCALGGGLHLIYLGKPLRAWRTILRPKTSELSRGTILLGGFLIMGLLQLALSLKGFQFLPWSEDALFFKIMLSILGFFVITHGFMTLSVISAVPFWNSAIMPPLSLVSGIWVGTQLAIGLSSGVQVAVEGAARWSIFSYALLVLFYLWNAKHSSLASQKSYHLLSKGELAPHFYIGVVLIALLIPLIITVYIYARPGEPALGMLYVRVICALIGDLALRYCIFKAARYMPLINSNVVRGLSSV